MNTLTTARLSILTTLARKQKFANMILLVVMVLTMIYIQMGIDAKTDFFLQGYGNCVYITATIVFLLVWWAASQKVSPGQNKEKIILIKDGVISSTDDNLLAAKLLKNYLKVIIKLGLDYKDYTLILAVNKTTNAFATGLSQGKVVCVYTQTVIDSTEEELQAVIAHEFGHTVNRDVAFSVIRASLGCGVGLFGGLIGAIVVWNVWGLSQAIDFYLITGVLVPYVVAYASRNTEYYADAFATINGYGPGLKSFLLRVLPGEKKHFYGPGSTHPAPSRRARSIDAIHTGDEGIISDKVERDLWFFVKALGIAALAAYVYYTGDNILHSVEMIVLAGSLFLGADSLLNSNPATYFAAFKAAKDSTNNSQIKLGDCLSAVWNIILLITLYVGGMIALFSFLGTTSVVLGIMVKITIWLWCTKPITSIIGMGNDFMSTVSDLSTYFGYITAVMMILSFFVKF